jgi:hypothetical protein
VKKRKGGTHNFRISELGVSGFQMSNNSANISRSSEKVRWDPKFQDFGTRGFGVSNVNNRARHFLRFRKGKVGPATSGFGTQGFGFQMSTTAQDISRGSEKVKWDPLLRDFRDLRTHGAQPQKKKENRKAKSGSFGVSGFGTS